MLWINSSSNCGLPFFVSESGFIPSALKAISPIWSLDWILKNASSLSFFQRVILILSRSSWSKTYSKPSVRNLFTGESGSFSRDALVILYLPVAGDLGRSRPKYFTVSCANDPLFVGGNASCAFRTIHL